MALKKLREMLDSKEISAVELTEQYLDRIENSDKEINKHEISRAASLSSFKMNR